MNRNVIKKFLALLLSLVMTCALFACDFGNASTTPEAVPQKDFSQFAGIVAEPKAWYDTLMAMPIANENMTEQELRQLCVDAFKMNLTFCWTPNTTITYTYTLLGRESDVRLPSRMAYSGLAYATGIANATCGNVWKILPYYDYETGALDVEAMGENALNYMTSACAYGAQQGWNRVSNSHGITSMSTYNQHSSGIVPVGPYTYERSTYNYDFGSRTASDEIIAANGNEVMYESLAMMKMADGVYSSSSWHVMMCCEDPVVVRNEDGTVNPFESYVLVHEQGAGGTKSDDYNYTQSNGKMIRPLGTINNKYTFKTLIEKGYIPFTLKEFTGQDPVEAGEAWLCSYDVPVKNGTDMTISALSRQTLCANYIPCTVLVEVKAPDGAVLFSYYPHALTTPYTFEILLSGMLDTEKLAPYANGENTIHISARLANGELKEAFNTILRVN